MDSEDKFTCLRNKSMRVFWALNSEILWDMSFRTIWVLQDSIAKLWWNGKVFPDFQLNIISLLSQAPSKLNLSNSKWEHQWMIHWSFQKAHSLWQQSFGFKSASSKLCDIEIDKLDHYTCILFIVIANSSLPIEK